MRESRWQVTFEDLDAKNDGKLSIEIQKTVDATSRKDAIRQVKEQFPLPRYDNHKARRAA